MNIVFAPLRPPGPPPDADALLAAIALDPENAQLHHTLGVALLLRDDVAGAASSFERSVELAPADPHAHCSLGQVHLMRNELDRASARFERAIELDPNAIDAHAQLAVVLMVRGRAAEAVTVLEQCIERHPGEPLLLANLGAAHRAAGNSDAAVAAYRRVIALQPEWAAIHADLAATLHRDGRFTEALAERRKVVDLQPDSADAYNELATILQVIGETDESIAAYERAAELRPDWYFPLRAAGTAAACVGDAARAIPLFRRALDLQPDAVPAHVDLGMMSLLVGDYAQGLREYEWRWPNGGVPYHRQELKVPLWDGSPLAGRSLLLWCEQGFGDVLQFARFIRRIPKDGGRVVLHAPKRLARLLAACDGVDQTVIDGEWLEADVQFPLLSLPFALGLSLDSLAGTPYLRAPERCAKAEELIPRDETVLNVGCVWASGPLYRRHRLRDCDVHSIAALAGVPGVRLFSLQFGMHAPDAEPYAEQIVDLTDDLGDFAQTAAFVERLDLIVTVDTAMAHFAGGLGKPVWLLLNANPDWRWMIERPDSPWYPTMRIYRQSRAGDWTEALERVRRDLGELARDRGCTRPVAPPLPAPLPRTKKAILKQYGERRTGTNFLRTLLSANYHAEVLMHILGDKHSPAVPFDEYWRDAQDDPDPARAFVCRATFSAPSATTDPGDLLQVEEATSLAVPIAEAFTRGELRFVVSIRDPYAWAVSLAWFLGWCKRNEPLPDERADELRAACLQFNQRYAAWLTLADAPSRAFFVRYEDLLTDAEAVCDRIARAAGLVRRSRRWRHQEETVLPAVWDNDVAPRLSGRRDLANDREPAGTAYLSTGCRAAVEETIDWELVERIYVSAGR